MQERAHYKLLQPISRNTLQEKVHLRIRQGLIDGEFPPGQVLTIRELAAHLGTSVMPVREALHKLTVERVLELLPTRSVRVPILSADQFGEICEARMILEGNIARIAAQRATPDDINRIEAASRAFLSAKNNKSPSLLNQRNREFHFAIYETARHSTLMELIEPLWVRCGPCTLALFEELGHEQIKHSASNHHQMALDAIRKHQPDDAYDAIISDIRATSERYQSHVRKSGADGSAKFAARSGGES
jgi:DNA-binding GntR family transcriptional regulator